MASEAGYSSYLYFICISYMYTNTYIVHVYEHRGQLLVEQVQLSM
jgi:hypothetical protein